MKNVLIAINTHNHVKYIAQCIECSLNQTYPCKVFVTDDGSKDGTQDVIMKYAPQLYQIKLHEDNSGNCMRCGNETIDMSKGFDYVFRHDGDDMLYPNAIELEVECGEKYNADWVYGGNDIINEGGTIVDRWKYDDCPESVTRAIAMMWRRRGLCTTLCALFRSKFLEGKRFSRFPSTTFAIDTSTAMDFYALWPTIRRVKAQVNRYRVHSGSETSCTSEDERAKMEADLIEKMKVTFGYYNIMEILKQEAA